MHQSVPLSVAGDRAGNPGQTPTNGSHTGPVFAHITGPTHGPRKPKPVPKSKTPGGDIVGKESKAAVPGKKSSPKAKGGGKAK